MPFTEHSVFTFIKEKSGKCFIKYLEYVCQHPRLQDKETFQNELGFALINKVKITVDEKKKFSAHRKLLKFLQIHKEYNTEFILKKLSQSEQIAKEFKKERAYLNLKLGHYVEAYDSLINEKDGTGYAQAEEFTEEI